MRGGSEGCCHQINQRPSRERRLPIIDWSDDWDWSSLFQPSSSSAFHIRNTFICLLKYDLKPKYDLWFIAQHYMLWDCLFMHELRARAYLWIAWVCLHAPAVWVLPLLGILQYNLTNCMKAPNFALMIPKDLNQFSPKKSVVLFKAKTES